MLERLYLGLGHERFVDSVFVFGSRTCRYCCLPIHPLKDFHYPTMCKGPGAEHPEVEALLAELGRRFRLRLTPSAGTMAVRIVIDGEQPTGRTR